MDHESFKTTGDIFRDLTPQQRAQIEQRIAYITYPEGHIFHAPGEYNEHLFILKSGRVQIYKTSPEGRILRIMVLNAVTIFGEMTLADHKTHTCFAEATGECVVGTIQREVLDELFQTYPQITMRFMEVIGERIQKMENKLVDVAFKSVPQRLATVLLNLAETPIRQGMPPAVMRYTHQQLAEMIGSYRETVTKTIGEFREEGLIRIEGDAIYLTDVEKLQQLIK